MRHLASIGLGIAVVSAIGLVATGAATAHPGLLPESIEAGADARLVVQVPNEREGRETVGVTLTFPKGIVVVEAAPVGDWTPRAGTVDATWRGGRISAADTVDFPLTIRAGVPAGSYDVTLVQAYDDGRSVSTTTPILILPAAGDNAPSQHPRRAIAAAIAGILVVGGSLVGLRILRRRPNPE